MCVIQLSLYESLKFTGQLKLNLWYVCSPSPTTQLPRKRDINLTPSKKLLIIQPDKNTTKSNI